MKLWSSYCLVLCIFSLAINSLLAEENNLQQDIPCEPALIQASISCQATESLEALEDCIIDYLLNIDCTTEVSNTSDFDVEMCTQDGGCLPDLGKIQ